jgi:hypothetical protein
MWFGYNSDRRQHMLAIVTILTPAEDMKNSKDERTVAPEGGTGQGAAIFYFVP